MKPRGVCSKQRIVYGIVTVSGKGQIAIPVDARRDLDIKAGDKLLVLKRKDEAGLVLIKLDKMDELMFLIQENEDFFKKLKEVIKMSEKYTCKDSDLLPAVNGEGSSSLTPRRGWFGLWAHHLLPLPVSIQPTGPVFGPLPLPQSGSGLSLQRPPFRVLTATVSSLQ